MIENFNEELKKNERIAKNNRKSIAAKKSLNRKKQVSCNIIKVYKQILVNFLVFQVLIVLQKFQHFFVYEYKSFP